MQALLKRKGLSVQSREEPPAKKAAAPCTPPKADSEVVLQKRLDEAEAVVPDKFVSAMWCVNYVDVFACSKLTLSVCFESNYMFKSSNTQ